VQLLPIRAVLEMKPGGIIGFFNYFGKGWFFPFFNIGGVLPES